MKKAGWLFIAALCLWLVACSKEEKAKQVKESKKEETTESADTADIQKAIQIEEEVFHIWKDELGYDRVTYAASVVNTGDEALSFALPHRHVVNEKGDIVGSFLLDYTFPYMIRPGEKAYYTDTALLEVKTDEKDLRSQLSFDTFKNVYNLPEEEMYDDFFQVEDVTFLETKDAQLKTSSNPDGSTLFEVSVKVSDDGDIQSQMLPYDTVAVIRDKEGKLVSVVKDTGIGEFSAETGEEQAVLRLNDYNRFGTVSEEGLSVETYAYYVK